MFVQPGHARPLDRRQVLDVVRQQAVEFLGAPTGLRESTALADELGLDSIVLVEWTMALEDAFDVELPEEDVTVLRTLAELVDLVMRQAQF